MQETIDIQGLINKGSQEYQKYKNGVQMIDYRGIINENVELVTNIEIDNVYLLLISLGNSCFSHKHGIDSIKFKNDCQLTEIKSKALKNSSIRKIYLPSSLEIIGKKLVLYSNLNFLEISNSYLFEVKNGLFIRKETDHETIILANPNTDKDISIHTNVTIGIAAFKYNVEITKVTIPNSLTNLSKRAFYRSSLQEIVFGQDSKLLIIEESAFEGWTHLTMFTCTSSLKTIGTRAFANSGLQKINIDENSQLQDILEAAFKSTKIQEFTIPVNVLTISPLTFKDCKDLIVIYMHNFLKSFGYSCLENCQINSLILPYNIECLDDFCLSYNKNLKTVDFSSCRLLRYVSPSAFDESAV